MSGRIRTIKPELLEDAVAAGLSDRAFRIFVGSIVLADDYGRLRAEPSWLLGQIFWSHPVKDISAALTELAPLMHFYEVSGQRYAEIRNWSKHQKVSHPGKPRIPAPPETLAKSSGDPPESLPRSSGESPETLMPDLRPTTNDHDHDQRPPARSRGSRATEGRGSRLPPEWQPDDETQAWVREQGIDPLGQTLAEFRDYWAGVPGARGTKLDWDATFRNQIRRIASRPIPAPRSSRQPLRDPNSATWLKAGGGDL